MEALASAECSFMEEALIFDPAAGRRRRMEIRRLKHMASGGDGTSKRSRPVSVTICGMREGELVISPLAKPLAEADTSQFLAEIQHKGDLGQVRVSEETAMPCRGGGLVRSASFPPEGWERSAKKFAVKASNTISRSSSTGSRDEAAFGFMKEATTTTIGVEHGDGTKGAAQPSSCTARAVEVASTSSHPAYCSPPSAEEKHPQQPQQQQQQQKEEKQDIELQVDESEVWARTPARRGCFSDGRCPPNGKLWVCGRRREMEDTVAAVPSFMSLPCNAMGGCFFHDPAACRSPSSLHFFGVYDGHGGDQASRYCSERLHQALAEEVTSVAALVEQCDASAPQEWQSRWEKAMAACFLKVDKEVGGVCPNGECNHLGRASSCCTDSIAPENVGSTAVVAVVGSCQIIVGNCGDSRAVLSRGGKAIALSRDHKPQREDETNRIEAAGGRVIDWDGYRVGGLLAMSRAIGDRYLKQYVISEPEVTCMQRTEDDEFLILASDGLWDVISNDMACDIARKCLATARRKCKHGYGSAAEQDPPTAAVAALLVKLAYSKGSKDNISVVVVDLKYRNS